MSTIMFQTRFAEPIRTGRKCQTIRPPRKRPIVVGELLSLRQWQGKAYRSPQLEIAAVRCSGLLDIFVSYDYIAISGTTFLQTRAMLDEFATCDGFDDWLQMREYLTAPAGYGLPFRGMLIQWDR